MKPYRLKSATHCVALNVLCLTALVLALVAPHARADLVYVASGGGTVSVIDGQTNSVTATINFDSSSEPFAIAISPDGTRAYVALVGSSQVAVVDTATNSVITTVSLGAAPTAIAVSKDGTRGYVATLGGVTFLDLTHSTVSMAISVPNLGPTDVALSADGQSLYVVDERRLSTTLIVNTNTGAYTGIPVAGVDNCTGISMTPDGSSAYLACNGYVEVLATPTNTEVAQIALPDSGSYDTVSPDGKTAFVSNYVAGGAGYVGVIDTASNTLTSQISVGTNVYPQGGAVSQDGTRLYVPNSGNGTVSVIDTATHTVVATVQVGEGAMRAAVKPDSVPFANYSATLYLAPKLSELSATEKFTLAANGSIDPSTQPVNLKFGALDLSIPAGSFVRDQPPRTGSYVYQGTIDGVNVYVSISPTGKLNTYQLFALGSGYAVPTGLTTVQVALTIGKNTGSINVTPNYGPKVPVSP